MAFLRLQAVTKLCVSSVAIIERSLPVAGGQEGGAQGKVKNGFPWSPDWRLLACRDHSQHPRQRESEPEEPCHALPDVDRPGDGHPHLKRTQGPQEEELLLIDHHGLIERRPIDETQQGYCPEEHSGWKQQPSREGHTFPLGN